MVNPKDEMIPNNVTTPYETCVIDLRSLSTELISEFRRWKLVVSFMLMSLNSISLSFFKNFPEVSIFDMFTRNSDTLIGSLWL